MDASLSRKDVLDSIINEIEWVFSKLNDKDKKLTQQSPVSPGNLDISSFATKIFNDFNQDLETVHPKLLITERIEKIGES